MVGRARRDGRRGRTTERRRPSVDKPQIVKLPEPVKGGTARILADLEMHGDPARAAENIVRLVRDYDAPPHLVSTRLILGRVRYATDMETATLIRRVDDEFRKRAGLPEKARGTKARKTAGRGAAARKTERRGARKFTIPPGEASRLRTLLQLFSRRNQIPQAAEVVREFSRSSNIPLGVVRTRLVQFHMKGIKEDTPERRFFGALNEELMRVEQQGRNSFHF